MYSYSCILIFSGLALITAIPPTHLKVSVHTDKSDDQLLPSRTKIHIHEKLNLAKHSYFHKNDDLNLQSIASLFTMSLLSGTPLADSAEYGLVTYPKTAVVNNNSIIKAEIDGKRFLKNIYRNRKELAKHTVDYTESELRRPEWIEIGRELLDIEGDLLPDIKVQVPFDWNAAINSSKNGKFDLIINGETFALDIGSIKNLKDNNEDIIIHVKGYKWNDFHTDSTVERMTNESHPFFVFWDSSLILGKHVVCTNGNAILAIFALGILIVHIIIHYRYISERKREKSTIVGRKVSFKDETGQALQSVDNNDPSSHSSLKRDKESYNGDAINTISKRKGRFLSRFFKRRDIDTNNMHSLLTGTLSMFLEDKITDEHRDNIE